MADNEYQDVAVREQGIGAPEKGAPQPEPRYVVCVGASAGGLEPLQQFFSKLPDDTGAAYVLVLHLSPDFKSMMPELLSKHTKMSIGTVGEDEDLKPNTVHLIPPRKNMVLSGNRLLLSDQDRSPGHPVNSPIDNFLSSLADERGPNGVAVILSGTGSDGSRGIERLKDAGGVVFVQEPGSAKFDGMPISAINTRIVDHCAEPRQLAKFVGNLVRYGLPAAQGVNENTDELGTHAISIVDILKQGTSVDFKYCRETMLMRRARRRMALLGLGAFSDYIDMLSNDAQEVRRLGDDLLIGVTSFFRDPSAFEALKRHISLMIANRSVSETFRVWVPACSTGQEAYSIAMLISEAMEASGRLLAVKIFATDLDQEALTVASAGVYSATDVQDIPSRRLSRFFVAEDNKFQVKQELRDMVIFARQDIVADPPFTKIDIVSCRNFLIYAKPQAQEHVLGKFQFALCVGGLMFLGSGESLGRLEQEFDVLDHACRIFKKTRQSNLAFSRTRFGSGPKMFQRPAPVAKSTASERADLFRPVAEALCSIDSRTVAVLDSEGTLTDVVDDTLGVFRLSKGNPTTDAMRLVSEQIATAIATGLHRLRSGEEGVHYVVANDRDHGPSQYKVRLATIPATETGERQVLFVVEAALDPSDPIELSDAAEASSHQIGQLQAELLQTRESLQASIEELQTSNEEQQSTNEELVASNEEMQSTNEELLSVNEELSTVNLEYQRSNRELEVLAADLENLLQNIEVGTIFLDNEFLIRKFTPTVCGIIKLVEHDIGRPIEHFKDHLDPDLLVLLKEVSLSGVALSQEFRGSDGRWYQMRVLPYITSDKTPTGVLLTFVDITAMKNSEETMRMMNNGLVASNRRLAEQREELEDLFSIVAHDLKRPTLSLDGLLKLCVEAEGEKREDLLRRSIDEVARMRTMLTDLAQMSSASRKRVQYETVQLKVWINEVLERFRAKASEMNVGLNCVCDQRQVMIPVSAIEEIINNLVENAFNYGTTGATPQIDVTCELIGPHLRVTVRDNGKGIAAHNHEKIFEPFRRFDTNLAEGSGIGLVAVRRLVHRLGGAIELESEIDEGAKFSLLVPIDRNAEQLGQDNKLRVLLVDDDALDVKVILRALGDDHDTTVARSLSDAISNVEKKQFDLILLDLSLVDGHGFRLVARLQELHLDTPVVVLSGQVEGIATEAMQSSVSGFIEKGNLTPQILSERIDHAMESNRHGHQLAGASDHGDTI